MVKASEEQAGKGGHRDDHVTHFIILRDKIAFRLCASLPSVSLLVGCGRLGTLNGEAPLLVGVVGGLA